MAKRDASNPPINRDGIERIEPNEPILDETAKMDLAALAEPFAPIIQDAIGQMVNARISELATNERVSKLQMTHQETVNQQNIDFNVKRLEYEELQSGRKDGKDRRHFWVQSGLIALFTLFLLSVSASLIFVKNEVQAGLLIITHAVALALGILGGRGLAKPSVEPEQQDPTKK
jgi:hypothetical protein